MIIPGFFYLFFRRPTVTLAWSLVAANVIVFIYTQFAFSSWPSISLSEQVKDKNFSVAITEMYHQTLDPIELNSLESVSVAEALRDHRFWKRIATFPFSGDEVQIDSTRKRLLQFQSEYFSSSQFQLGLGRVESSP